jgi:hypothetical protein
MSTLNPLRHNLRRYILPLNQLSGLALLRLALCAGGLLLSTALSAEVALDTTRGALPPPQIAVTPSRLTLEIGSKPVGAAIRLFNLSKKPITLTASIAHFDLDDDNKIRVIAPTPQSLDQWVLFNPASFTIQPREQQVVRLSVRPKVRPEPGEHRAIMFFENVMDSGSETTVNVSFRLGVVIYGMASPVESTAVLHQAALVAEPGRLKLSLDVEGTGNAHARVAGQFSLWPAEKFPGLDDVPDFDVGAREPELPGNVAAAGLLSATPVLAGTRRSIPTFISRPPEPGPYLLALKGTLGGARIDRVIPITLQ